MLKRLVFLSAIALAASPVLAADASTDTAQADPREDRANYDDVLGFALDACTQGTLADWDPAPPSTYVDGVVAEHHAAWIKWNVRGGVAAFEMLNDDGLPVDFLTAEGKKFEVFKFQSVARSTGSKQTGCSVHLYPHEALSMEEMEAWSSAKPNEMMIGVLVGEDSWQLTPPEGSGWEYAIVSHFDPEVLPWSDETPRPFRGLIIRFTKTEF